MKDNISKQAAHKPRRTKEERDRQVGINGLAAKTPRRRAAPRAGTETVEQFEARGGLVEVLPSVWSRAA